MENEIEFEDLPEEDCKARELDGLQKKTNTQSSAIKLKAMNHEEVIENFGALPAEERARLVAQQEANEWAAIERMKQEHLNLETRNQEMEALLERRRAFAKRLG